jgi:hypothetical protein
VILFSGFTLLVGIAILEKSSVSNLKKISALLQFLIIIATTIVLIVSIRSQKQENQKITSIIYLALNIMMSVIGFIVALIIFTNIIIIVVHLIMLIIMSAMYFFYGRAISHLNKGSIYVNYYETKIDNNNNIQN